MCKEPRPLYIIYDNIGAYAQKSAEIVYFTTCDRKNHAPKA